MTESSSEKEIPAEIETDIISDEKPNDKIPASQNAVNDYEARLAELRRALAETQEQLSNKTKILRWILNSRSWKLTNWLRANKVLNQKNLFRQLKLKEDCFSGALESPSENAGISGAVEITGWAYSSEAPVASVEVLLDYISVGKLNWGLPRPAPKDSSSDIPLNCGYAGRIIVDDSFSGQRNLIVRVTDKAGNVKDYPRTVSVEDSGEGITGFAAGNAAGETIVAKDELSTGKKLLTSLARAELNAFLLSDLKIEFPKIEEPEISIILVLYNRAELTLQCLYSILKSDYKSYEVLIVDNASTDETHRLLERVGNARIIYNENNLHYLRACNRAARESRGKYILLLNNDARLAAASLGAALETIQSSEDIGAVGGKIILPDGTLQEAGSIVWQEGTVYGYGRSADPFAPEYMFRRDVDYCSGAFLLTRSDLFLAAGGYDEAYAPAYYEETDYCVRLWKQGKRVVYDPQVMIFHYEFGSSQTAKNVTDLTTAHRQIFLEKHRDWLRIQNRESSQKKLFARQRLRNGAKRILLFAERIPHRLPEADASQSNYIIRQLAGNGHFVTCYLLEPAAEDWRSVYRDIPGEVEVITTGGLSQLEKFLTERWGYYDALFAEKPDNAAVVNSCLERLPHLKKEPRAICDIETLFEMFENAGKKIQR
jgi:GT2 family glycosyltransferase